MTGRGYNNFDDQEDLTTNMDPYLNVYLKPVIAAVEGDEKKVKHCIIQSHTASELNKLLEESATVEI